MGVIYMAAGREKEKTCRLSGLEPEMRAWQNLELCTPNLLYDYMGY